MKPRTFISSISNNQMKNITLLLKKAKAREEQGLFVVEGLKMFEEARGAGLLCKAYASESFYNEKSESEQGYFDDLDFEVVTDNVFKEISETKTPQGIMGTVSIKQYSLDDMLNAPDAGLMLLEDIRDPGNLGTIIRTSEGAGITGIILNSSCVDIYNPKVVRSTMGSIFRVPIYMAEDFFGTAAKLKEHGINIFAAHLLGKPYDTQDCFKGKFAFLIGNEANGLSEEASGLADELIKIPMAGKVESLNAAVAAAILMYEAARQRRS